jgi:hypothetical protein
LTLSRTKPLGWINALAIAVSGFTGLIGGLISVKVA